MKCCRVIVDGTPFVNEEGFTYRIPTFLQDVVQVGSMVAVPFGKKNLLKKGFVVSMAPVTAETPIEQLKEIVLPYQLQPVISADMMALCYFVAERYACALIYAIKQVVPKYMMHHFFVACEEIESGKKYLISDKTIRAYAFACAEGTMRLIPHQPNVSETSCYYCLSSEASREDSLNKLQRAPKQKKIFQYIAERSSVSMEMLKDAFGACQPTLKVLCEKGLITQTASVTQSHEEPTHHSEPVMTQQQKDVFSALMVQLQKNCYQKSLINGVTGSGKTLIYEKIAEKVLAAGRQVLILVPEIVLSQQLFLRLEKRFGKRIALLHSQLGERERYQIWQQVNEREIDIVLGPRSALFLPFSALGLIIIDEEHESSYKQSEPDPRYHAMVVAEYLAKRDNALLLLGSATPSIETLYEVVQKQCSIYNLPERVHQAALPEITLIDMAEERRQGHRGLISEPLAKAMRATLARGEQIILLINRKGYASSVSCHECGEVIRCPRCDIPLTYYQSTGELKCNYCEFHLPLPKICPSCHSDFLEKRGSGTESVEQICARLFPDAVIDRLDAQALENKVSRETILSRYANHQIDILVGTQLLAKGLDFLNTTCIGVINADLTLNLPDFRSAERCFQLMVQVAGRAGRDQKPSRVFIQTFQPEHYALQDAVQQNVHQFFLDEIAFRKQWLYPPMVRLCRIIVSDFEPRDVEKSMRSIYNDIVQLPFRKELIGPSYAPLSKKNNRYRMHLIIKAVCAEDIQQMMRQFRAKLPRLHLKQSTRVLIDIDPENIF